MHRLIRDLHPDIATYKGMSGYRQTIIDYLGSFDDGAPTSSGTASEQTSL